MEVKIVKQAGGTSSSLVSNSESNEDVIILIYDNWNDYGYITCFSVMYLGKILGVIRLYVPELDNDRSWDGTWHGEVFEYLRTKSHKPEDTLVLEASSEILAEIKMSLGDNDYYKNVDKEVPSQLVNEFLKALKDITTISEDEISKYYSKPIVVQSLRRTTDSETIIEMVRFAKEFSFSSDKILKIITDDQLAIGDLYDESEADYSRFFYIYENDYSFALALVEMLAKRHTNTSLNDRDRDFLEELFDVPVDRADLSKKIAEILGVSSEIISAVSEIKQSLLLSEHLSDAALGQYTQLATLPKLLVGVEDKLTKTEKSNNHSIKDTINKNTGLRLSNSHQMNDPKEGRALLDFLGLENENAKDYTNSSIYVASATSNLDSLPMWKQYTDDAKGVVMVFSSNFIDKVCSQDDYDVARVCYIKSEDNETSVIAISGLAETDPETDKINKNLSILRRSVADAGEDFEKLSRIRVLVRKIVPFFKNGDYAYENEFRIVSYQEKFGNDNISLNNVANSVIPRLYTYLEDHGQFGNKPIIPKFSRIILGPKAPEIDFIAPFIKFQDPSIEVKKSKINYR